MKADAENGSMGNTAAAASSASIGDPGEADAYALQLASDSYNWYRTAAIRSRRMHRIVEFLIILASASIPIVALSVPDSSLLTAIFGGAIAVLAGLRAIFHWSENYVRFSTAREAVEAERRLYITKGAKYADPATRAYTLASAVTAIERGEIGRWVELVSKQPSEK